MATRGGVVVSRLPGRAAAASPRLLVTSSGEDPMGLVAQVVGPLRDGVDGLGEGLSRVGVEGCQGCS